MTAPGASASSRGRTDESRVIIVHDSAEDGRDPNLGLGSRGGRPRARPPGTMQRYRRILLYLERISVSFDGFKAINDLTLYIKEGELRCVIGPNGAGKTTLMDIITGKTRPDCGSAWFTRELDLLASDEVTIAQAGIGRKFQKPSVFEAMTVHENLELALAGPKTVWKTFRARLSGADRDFIGETLERTGLRDLRRLRAGLLSHGQKQWLEIGMLLMQRPKLLLLDEPVAGMTPREIERTAELLRGLAGRHSIMVVEHDMEFVRAVAHRTVTVLHQGAVLAEGSMDDIQRDPAVIAAYLGEAPC